VVEAVFSTALVAAFIVDTGFSVAVGRGVALLPLVSAAAFRRSFAARSRAAALIWTLALGVAAAGRSTARFAFDSIRLAVSGRRTVRACAFCAVDSVLVESIMIFFSWAD